MLQVANTIMKNFFFGSDGAQLPLEGSKLYLPCNSGGLGQRYYKSLTKNLEKTHQIDHTTSSQSESKESVRNRSISLAVSMRNKDILPGDVIVISSKCHMNQTIVVLASLFAGAIIATVDPELTYKDCKALLEKLKPKICFCDIRAVSQLERALHELKLPVRIVNFKTQFTSFCGDQETEHFTPYFIKHPKNTAAFIVATQATSGAPKLVTLSHNNILFQTILFLKIIQHPNSIMSFFQLSWIVEIIVMCSCFESNTIRIIPGEFHAKKACKLIQSLQVDFAFLGTYFAKQLVSHVAIRDYNISCLKTIMVGVTSTTKNCIKQLRFCLPKVNIIQAYYLTETGLISACSLTNYLSSLDKPSSVGKIVNNTRIKIVDLTTRQLVNPDFTGELLYEGDGFMLNYYNDNTLILNAMEGGFFKTGDLAKYDKDGWIYIVGRLNDLIPLQEDYKFNPIEMEEVILLHPHVIEAVVIGNEDKLICCVVKEPESSLSPEQLMTFLSANLKLEHYPSDILFLESLPKTQVGSIKRHKLREDYLANKIEWKLSLTSLTSVQQNN